MRLEVGRWPLAVFYVITHLSLAITCNLIPCHLVLKMPLSCFAYPAMLNITWCRGVGRVDMTGSIVNVLPLLNNGAALSLVLLLGVSSLFLMATLSLPSTVRCKAQSHEY